MAFMELSNSTLSGDLLIHRRPIPFPATLKKTNAGSPSSIKFPLHSASSLSRPLYLSSSFHISAKFGRPINRQNYFRKKLTQLQQVSDISDFSKSPHENANSEVISNAGEKSGAKLESKSTRDSVLSSNLEGWDEKFKDSEFWGKVAKPILTVFKHYNVEVEGVVLHRNKKCAREIVKLISSTKDPSIFHHPKKGAISSITIGGLEMLVYIIMGIIIFLLYATMTGLEMLEGIIGLSMIFVVLASLILISMMPVILCFWVIKKLVNLWSNYRQGKSEKEVLRRNKEILRRKKEEELMENTLPVHLDDKIQEIKEMARGVRELEVTEVLTCVEDDHISKEGIKGREKIEKPTLVCKASDSEFSSADDSQGDDVYWLMI